LFTTPPPHNQPLLPGVQLRVNKTLEQKDLAAIFDPIDDLYLQSQRSIFALADVKHATGR
jgi:hypothetical protein